MTKYTYCFDNNIHECNDQLTSNISNHGGMSTNIDKAFKYLDKLLENEK